MSRISHLFSENRTIQHAVEGHGITEGADIDQPGKKCRRDPGQDIRHQEFGQISDIRQIFIDQADIIRIDNVRGRPLNIEHHKQRAEDRQDQIFQDTDLFVISHDVPAISSVISR